VRQVTTTRPRRIRLERRHSRPYTRARARARAERTVRVCDSYRLRFIEAHLNYRRATPVIVFRLQKSHSPLFAPPSLAEAVTKHQLRPLGAPKDDKNDNDDEQ